MAQPRAFRRAWSSTFGFPRSFATKSVIISWLGVGHIESKLYISPGEERLRFPVAVMSWRPRRRRRGLDSRCCTMIFTLNPHGAPEGATGRCVMQQRTSPEIVPQKVSRKYFSSERPWHVWGQLFIVPRASELSTATKGNAGGAEQLLRICPSFSGNKCCQIT